MDATTQESLLNAWADVLLALVSAYRGHRLKMWSRIPDMMCSEASRTSHIDRWYTQTLRALQIETQGSASSPSSLCSMWPGKRAWFLALADEPAAAERLALRTLRDSKATITALAQVRWDEIKARRATAGAEATDE